MRLQKAILSTFDKYVKAIARCSNCIIGFKAIWKQQLGNNCLNLQHSGRTLHCMAVATYWAFDMESTTVKRKTEETQVPSQTEAQYSSLIQQDRQCWVWRSCRGRSRPSSPSSNQTKYFCWLRKSTPSQMQKTRQLARKYLLRIGEKGGLVILVTA